MTPCTVRINRKGADRITSGHPWIFASDVLDRGEAQPGDVVRVADPRGHALGVAHFSSSSQISLRLLSRHVEPVDRDFYLGRLRQALDFRRRCAPGATACRIVHGEADLLPGLVVDRYGAYLSVQFLDQGMDRARDMLVSCLEELLAPAAIVARNDAPVRQREQLPLEAVVLSGELPARVEIEVNGLRLEVDLLHGQKTGVFLDQRENYLAATRWAPKGPALDCFTSAGGFALHLARVCETVEAIDSSGDALEGARANALRNGIANAEFREGDVFDVLANYASARRRFSTVVLDPPAFAKSRGAVEGATRGYREINYRALRLLDSGGVLVTCSCSHHMSEAALLETVAAAALDARRTLRVLDRRTQAPDHPILLTVPETHYLKCLVLEVV